MMSLERFKPEAVWLLCVAMCACGGGGGEATSGDKQPDPPAAAPAPPVQAIDPLLQFQWHLINNAGVDLNVEPIWNSGLKGRGVLIAIVDDGIEATHEDLQENVSLSASHVFLGSQSQPSMQHGTAVAGLVAAVQRNGKGGSGVAPAATLASYALTDNPTDLNIEEAMRRDPTVAISNNSWSADPDNTGELYSPIQTWKQAINKGVTTGRDGLGTIYVWAAGNGGVADSEPVIDNSNYDGMANARQVLAVCAVGNQGKRANYSEQGANLWLCAPSGQGGLTEPSITTTDRAAGNGYNAGVTSEDYPNPSYTNSFAGTSASAPLVSGTIALMLEANPLLNWRDVRLILAQTASQNDESDSDWTQTGGSPKYFVNHKYGFGLINVDAAVTTARNWVSVGSERVVESQNPAQKVPIAIPDANSAGVTSTILEEEDVNIEFIEVTFSAEHSHHGDLTVTLTSPTNTKSVLAQAHNCYHEGEPTRCESDYDKWEFGVARHLGESSKGVWTLRVADELGQDEGTFESWSIKFYGH